MSRVLDDLGTLHMVHGVITYSAGVPSVTSNDGSLAVVDTEEGDVQITFSAFNSTPTVLCSVLKGTHVDATHNNVAAETVSTTAVDFRWLEHANGTANTSPDPADDEEIHFVLIGMRNN